MLRYDKNPPTPFIKSISEYGIVKVGFNETMQFKVALEESELNLSQRGERRLISGSITDELEGMVFGSSSQNFKNFSMINNSTILLDGQVLPSIQVSLVPADPETTCSDVLGFDWELVQFSGTEMTIQLFFETPMCVSGASHEEDELLITFND